MSYLFKKKFFSFSPTAAVTFNPEVTMPFGKSINLNSYIRHLPISAYKMLESLLDPGDMWEQFMENIPQYLDDPNSFLRYTAQDGL